MTTDEIIVWMTERGWRFHAEMVFSHVTVWFDRTEWRGQSLERPFAITRFGPPSEFHSMVSDAGREAQGLLLRFEQPPVERRDQKNGRSYWRASNT